MLIELFYIFSHSLNVQITDRYDAAKIVPKYCFFSTLEKLGERKNLLTETSTVYPYH